MYLPINSQEFAINFQTSVAPAKLSVIYNGIEKYNECTDFKSPDAPIVLVDRATVNPLVKIRVEHMDAFKTIGEQS